MIYKEFSKKTHEIYKIAQCTQEHELKRILIVLKNFSAFLSESPNSMQGISRLKMMSIMLVREYELENVVSSLLLNEVDVYSKYLCLPVLYTMTKVLTFFFQIKFLICCGIYPFLLLFLFSFVCFCIIILNLVFIFFITNRAFMRTVV